MSIPSVWTKQSPWSGGGVWDAPSRNPYNSKSGEVWNQWIMGDDGDNDGWWGVFKEWTDAANSSTPTWMQFKQTGNVYDTNAYSFVRDPYDPDWGRNIAPYTPIGASSSETIQHYLDEYSRGSKTAQIGDLGGSVGANSTATGLEGWEGVDAWNNAIINAQSAIFKKHGVFVPGNLIKAIMKLESNGENLAINSSNAVGPMQVTTDNWGGLGYDLFNPEQNIMAGVEVLALNYQQGDMNGNPSWEWAARRYIGLVGEDTYGTTQHSYWNTVRNNWAMLDNAVMYGQDSGQVMGDGMGVSDVLTAAKKYVGVPYVWGGIPGKGADPWETGWDCSGFIYWLDQNYGTGGIVQGSHYQFDDASKKGRLFTDPSQIQAGDIVYFDTGSRSGGGAHLNGASHVGLYLGGGKMLHAANPSQGTLISDYSDYASKFLGAERPAWSGTGVGGTSNGFLAITKGNPFPITQEYGITEWSKGEGKWMYSYSRDLGWPEGNAHPGLDVGTPEGTNLFSPMAGVVEYAGPGQGFTYNFHEDLQDSGGLFIRLTNGDVLILGHMRSIDVKAGDTITAGQFVGLSGAANGAHVHVEYREVGADGSQRSVDPRLALNGIFRGTYTNAGVYTDTERVTTSDNWLQFMKATATGSPISGYSAGGPDSYHNFLSRGVQKGWDFAAQQGVPGSNTIAYTWGVQFGQGNGWTNLADDIENGSAMTGD